MTDPKTKIFLAAFCGILFGAAGFFVLQYLAPNLAWPLSIASGAMFSFAIVIVLLVSEKRLGKKYAEAEKHITVPVLLKSNGNYSLNGQKTRNGNFYFTEEGILIFSLDQKPHVTDLIPVSSIENGFKDVVHLLIETNDGRRYEITSSDADRMLKFMKEKGWISLDDYS